MSVDHQRSGEVSDPVELRQVLGTFATGVTVVTVGGNQPHGMTANSFASVSLDPPLVLVCVGRQAVMHDSLVSAGAFAVSVLAADQEKIARHFANKWRPLGAAQFDDVEWRPGRLTGAPLIGQALAHFECELWRTYDGGDHSIFAGQLLSAQRFGAEDPLLFLRGRFRQLTPERKEMST
ncbi:flavin reductase family protein [Micromonospora sp. NBC_01813]|uniref:flavin reductase family protein n=1 Tax=Micromonospora sp. NBC_01813 TaxID=2975988 RepID=UPI002DDC86A9|nr:flavin reductase family protein [Micromonospora sp. NBC_01813]WSA09191.1 flavin reductase family protein [Micromonospora sp. NBC_01813]